MILKHIFFDSHNKDFVYLLVPELHEKGRYHFHGLIKGPLPHEEARNPWGKLILDDNGHQVYNIPIFKYGFTTAIKCYSQAATGYVAKYITKQDAVPEGKKRYWVSRNAARPKLEYLELDAAASSFFIIILITDTLVSILQFSLLIILQKAHLPSLQTLEAAFQAAVQILFLQQPPLLPLQNLLLPSR